ncbi:hypothetical protein QAD02_018352 [Eretmocerus hayati]|uniref:Uncharacterized protein n=1 Tax=Eretmocerus hayati TaxID=131215 RepID=A0ACC2PLA6_9HYME|nr:hypothetical protein QAD02_018352 [Eretmocerus hayati]
MKKIIGWLISSTLISIAVQSEDKYNFHEFDDHNEYQRVWLFTGNVTVFHAKKYPRDDSFLFAVCSSENASSNANCEISVKFFNDTSLQNKTCNLVFKPHHSNLFMLPKFTLRLESLQNPYKAVIAWNEITEDYERVYDYVSILNMETCENSTKNYSRSANTLEMNPNTFEFFITGNSLEVITSDRTVCGEFQICRLTYNEEYQKVHGPASFPTNLSTFYIDSAYSDPSSRNIYAYGVTKGSFGSEIEAYYITTNEVKKLTTNITNLGSIITPLISTTHDHFTLCGKYVGSEEGDLIHCIQYEIGSTEPKFDFEYEHFDRIVGVSNLAGGGFLIFSLDSEDSSIPGYTLIRPQIGSFNIPHNVEIDFYSSYQCISSTAHIIERISSQQSDYDVSSCFYSTCSDSFQNDHNKEVHDVQHYGLCLKLPNSKSDFIGQE